MSALNVKYSPNFASYPAHRAAAETASRWLAEWVGSPPYQVIAEWDVAIDDGGERVLTLVLRGIESQASGVFRLELFEDPIDAELRLRRVWGELLRAGTRKLLASISDSFGGGEE